MNGYDKPTHKDKFNMCAYVFIPTKPGHASMIFIFSIFSLNVAQSVYFYMLLS